MVKRRNKTPQQLLEDKYKSDIIAKNTELAKQNSELVPRFRTGKATKEGSKKWEDILKNN